MAHAIDSEALIAPCQALRRIFQEARAKEEAHTRSRELLAGLADNPKFLTAALQQHLENAGNLRLRHYPVISLLVESNPWFELVVNCWLPLPGRESDVSAKAIHHHGTMQLSTATIHGPGYEHWIYTSPEMVDPEREIFSMRLVERQQHPIGHVSWVDALVPHLPFYAPTLTVTAALWSHRGRVTWRDRLKRIPLLRRNAERLREVGARAGFAKALDLNVVNYFDFHPTEDGYRGMRERQEFPRGPAEDYLQSLFHVLQETGNDGLAPIIRARSRRESGDASASLIETLLKKLERGVPIEPRLSEGHYGVPFANLTRDAVERAVASEERNSAVRRTAAES